MLRSILGAEVSLMLMVLLSVESHSMMVSIFRSHGAGGRCRWVSRAFFRWWKSPSVRVYLRWKHKHLISVHQRGKNNQLCSSGPYLRPFSWVFFSCSYSADSLKDTLRPVEAVETNRSDSPLWQLDAERASDSSRRIVISEQQGRADEEEQKRSVTTPNQKVCVKLENKTAQLWPCVGWESSA